MKYSIVLFSLFLLPLFSFSQGDAIEDFIDYHEEMDHAYNLNVPGWLVRLGTFIAKDDLSEAEYQELKLITKKIQRIELLAKDEDYDWSVRDLDDLHESLIQDDYEAFASIKDSDTDVKVYVREKKDLIRNLIVISDEDNDFCMIHIKTRISESEISDMVNLAQNINRDVDIEININSDEDTDRRE